MTKLKDLHIGEEINKRIKTLGLTYSEVARQLHVDRTTIYWIIKSKSIDTERLVKLSNILDYNFFNLYIPYIFPKLSAPDDISILTEFLDKNKSLIITIALKKDC